MHTRLPLIWYYGSPLALFFLLMGTWRALWMGRIVRFVILITLLFTFVWMRYIEPQQITTRESTIDLGVGQTAVLIADLHLGIYKDRRYLQRVVNTINAMTGIDMILIAGDFIYNPKLNELEELFQPLADVRVPIYATLGNHDIMNPGGDIRNELVATLNKQRVMILNNDMVALSGRYLLGLGDHQGGEDNVFLLNQLHVADTVVVLTHNPDTTMNYTNHITDLTLVGHTHCGQVRAPFFHQRLKKIIIPVDGDFDCGLTQTKYTQLLITPGLGEVILPLRWFNPPTIDIVHF